MKAYKAMLKTELKLSIRGMDMIIFALCMPVVIMIILGIVYGSKPVIRRCELHFLRNHLVLFRLLQLVQAGYGAAPCHIRL
jgi:ABC-2 type transport system permease protein